MYKTYTFIHYAYKTFITLVGDSKYVFLDILILIVTPELAEVFSLKVFC